MKTTIYTHESALAHDTGESHPECTNRLSVIYDLLDTPPFDTLLRVKPPPAGMEHLLLAHRPDYIQKIEDMIPPMDVVDWGGEVILSPGTWEAALRAVGAGCLAVDDIFQNKTTRAFCAMRPPGHHALPDHAMGFCLFNNIFIAARHAQTSYGVKKIAIIDFDVHHGNGTDHMTRSHDGSILFISTHQYPLWPMSGHPDDNEESVQNWILPPGSGSEIFQMVYETKVFPAINAFEPEMIMISAGFDAHRDDPLGGLNLTADDFEWVTRHLCALANLTAEGRVLSLLEGGYDLNALQESVSAHLRALISPG